MYTYKIKEIVKIYDGDTITVIIDCGFSISVKKVIRLMGIDTPELRGHERPYGLASRQRLIELINEHPDIYIKTFKDKSGKYGRLLGLLMIPEYEMSLNEMLVKEGFAVKYTGGKKAEFIPTEQEIEKATKEGFLTTLKGS